MVFKYYVSVTISVMQVFTRSRYLHGMIIFSSTWYNYISYIYANCPEMTIIATVMI